MKLRLPSYSVWYPLLVAFVWAYPLSHIFAKPFWAFLYFDFLRLPLYVIRHCIGIGFLYLAVSSGAVFFLNVIVWIIPRFRKALRPHWSTHLASLVALWLFVGTVKTLSARTYPFIPPPVEREKKRPGDVSGSA